MATYVNDLRLTELATGEGSGTWGVTTNLNLELIGEALGYGTQDCFASDADATTTVADGASDPARAMYFKVTSSASLTATRTLTIAPNTVSRVMLIENATTGSQSIAISQGSGGNVTIASGQTKMVYLDGAGATAAVVDALADLELGTITVANLTATTADINGGSVDGVTLGTNSAVTEAQIDNINIDGNTISSTDTDGNITLSPNGSGSVAISKVDVAGGEIDAVTLGTNSAVTEAQIDNINIDGNTISSTDTNGDVTITPNGTGSVAISKVDIDGGTIDGADITVGSGKTLDVSAGTLTLANDQISGDAINGGTIGSTTITTLNSTTVEVGSLEVTNIKAKDGTSAGSIADSTGVVTLASSVLTTTDINGGTIDGTPIGANSASTGAFTTLAASGDVNFDSGTFFVDASADAVGIGTTSPSAPFHAVGDGASYNDGAAIFDRTNSNGFVIELKKDGTTVGGLLSRASLVSSIVLDPRTNGAGLSGGSYVIYPTDESGVPTDNLVDLGGTLARWDDVYATNGTIQTSDANEKQDIEELSEAERRVAVAAKGLLRKFRWISSVEEKGDDARIHFGIIAQDLQAAFEAEGLDAGRYAMFIHSTWTDEETGEERSRMGVRYSELLAFIIASI